MRSPVRACAIVNRGGRTLVFRHPLAGAQFVKGRIETGEDPASAAARELREEAGITPPLIGDLGQVDTSIGPWNIFAFADHGLPERWTHFAPDDGGHEFAFFWHPVTAELPAGSHVDFLAVLAHLRCG